MTTYWIVTLGKAEVADGTVTYIPALITEGPNVGQNALTILRSNMELESGEVTYEAHLNEPTSKCQVGLRSEEDGTLFAGLNVGTAGYGLSLFRNSKWEILDGVGSGNSVPTEEWISVKLRVLGSQIDLFVNEVKVCSTLRTIPKGQVELMLQGSQEIKVRNIKATASTPQAFVVMQFSDTFNALYTDVIKPTCEKFGLEAIRADDIYKCDLIINDIARSIEEASVIIADVTTDNPNVFYEVGYAHGIKKATILLSDRTREKLPFDVSGFRTLFYDNTIGGKSDVEARLTTHLRNIFGPSTAPGSEAKGTE